MTAGAWPWLVADDTFAALAGLGWELDVMTRPVTDRFHAKQSRNIGRLRLEGSGQALVVYLKRHFEPPSSRRESHSPARQEYDQLEWVRGQGVPVPRVVAAGERDRGPVRESFLALEELAGMLALHELIPLAHGSLDPAAFATWKIGVLGETARLAARLHELGAFHQDLYLCHFYAATATIDRVPNDWAGAVAVIDFHRLIRPARAARGWYRVKDLAQLRFSGYGVAGLTEADLAGWLDCYRARLGVPGWVRAAAAWKARRYLAHNQKH